MHYFDWASTSPVSREALDEYNRISLLYPGNPSSVHPMGLDARKHLDSCRSGIADMLRVNASEIFFTSGGTEADNIVLQSLLAIPSPGEVLVTSMEHAAVLENRNILAEHGWKVTLLPSSGGYIRPETLARALNPKVRMVCIMKVNNVTGSVQDTASLVKAIRSFEQQTGRRIHIHCDAVQALGKIPFYPSMENLDSAAFSAHKFSGPRGVGFLWCTRKQVRSLSSGGGQESGVRPGTENLAGISAMTLALGNSIRYLEKNGNHVAQLRSEVEKTAVELGFTLLSPSAQSACAFSPYIICFSVRPVPSEVFLRVMADKGFCLSAGSACSTNSKGKAERVLEGMAVRPEDRRSAVRVSFGPGTTLDETLCLCNALRQTAKELGNGKN